MVIKKQRDFKQKNDTMKYIFSKDYYGGRMKMNWRRGKLEKGLKESRKERRICRKAVAWKRVLFLRRLSGRANWIWGLTLCRRLTKKKEDSKITPSQFWQQSECYCHEQRLDTQEISSWKGKELFWTWIWTGNRMSVWWIPAVKNAALRDWWGYTDGFSWVSESHA